MSDRLALTQWTQRLDELVGHKIRLAYTTLNSYGILASYQVEMPTEVTDGYIDFNLSDGRTFTILVPHDFEDHHWLC